MQAAPAATSPSPEPLRQLRGLLHQHGAEMCLDPAHCARLLSGIGSDYPRELKYLLQGLRAGVPERLLRQTSAPGQKTLLAQLVTQVQQFAPTCERAWAVWTVHAWASALARLDKPATPTTALRDATLCVLQTPFSALETANPHALDLLSVVTGQAVRTGQGLERSYSGSRFSADGKYLALSSWCRHLSVCDSDSGYELLSWPVGPEPVQCLAFSADGRLLASGGWDGGVRLWRVADGSLVQTYHAHQGRVTALAFHPRGGVLASCGEDGAVRLWQTRHGPLRRRLQTWLGRRGALACLSHPGGKSGGLTFSPGGNQLACANEDAQVWLWDTRHLPRPPSSREVRILQGHRRGVEVLAFSPDGGLLASAGSDRAILLWDANHGTPLCSLPGHQAQVTHLLFSPHRRHLLSVGRDQTLRVWNPSNGRQRYQLDTGNFRPNSLSLVAPDLLRISGNFDKTLFDQTTRLRLPVSP